MLAGYLWDGMTLQHAILAFGFVTPAFVIAGVLLASVPIIIHILNRRRFRTVQWAAMEFLLQALRKNRRRLRFEQWLLLTVRCAVLAFLGLALARPLGCKDTSLASIAAQRSAMHVFVIDNSYSMAYEADRPGARTHLDQARLLAKRLIDRLSAGGESVAILTAAQPAGDVIAHPSYDLEAAKAAIDLIEQSHGGTDLPGALRKALDLAREESGQSLRYLHLFTDSTRSAWTGPKAESIAPLARELKARYRVAHFNLARSDQWNHAVIALRPLANLVRSHFDKGFQATVRGFGGSEEAMLQWRLDDQPLPGSAAVRPELNTPPITQSQARIDQGGPHVISALLASDNRLKVDDGRWCVIDVASELKVLIVEGERGVGPLGASGAFLQLALAPPSEDGTRGSGPSRSTSYVAPEVISDLEFAGRALGEYRAVILAGVAQIAPTLADQIKAFVEQGGTLIVFMGEAVNSESYNVVLLPRGLIPGALTRRTSVTAEQEPFHVDFRPHGPLHPLLNAFRNLEKSGLDTAEIFTYWRIALPSGTRVERVLDYLPDATGQRDPAVTTHDLGQGRVVFVSTTAGAEWTTLPAKPAYVALMHELLAGSIGGGDQWMNLVVGQPLQIPATVRLTAVPVLKDPQHADVVLEHVPGPDGRGVYRSRALNRSGVYTLSTGSRLIPIAVNVPDDEADIRPLDAAALRTALGGIELAQYEDQLPPVDEGADAGNDFGWSLMIAVLILVGFECFLAMRFGHYRR